MIKISSPGGYDRLEYCKLPECGYTEGANIKLDGLDVAACVLVKTYACGINFADVIIRRGLYPSAKKNVGWPITPGFEFSGVIEKVGERVSDFAIGDRVAGFSLFGGYSQAVLVPQEQIRKVPKNLSMSEAAGIILTSATAWYALFEMCKLREDDSILIHSASGGVGTMLAQMAKKKIGCYVVGVVGRSHKVDIAKEIGCDEVIDKSSQDLWSTAKELTVKGYKAIFDANGVDTLQQSYDHLASGGRLVSFGGSSLMPRSTEESTGYMKVTDKFKMGWKYLKSPTFNPLEMTSQNKSLMAFDISFIHHERRLLREFFSNVFSWINDGSLKVAKVTEYNLREVAKAHRDLESGNTIGKLVMLTHDLETDVPMKQKEENVTPENNSDSQKLLNGP